MPARLSNTSWCYNTGSQLAQLFTNECNVGLDGDLETVNRLIAPRLHETSRKKKVPAQSAYKYLYICAPRTMT